MSEDAQLWVLGVPGKGFIFMVPPKNHPGYRVRKSSGNWSRWPVHSLATTIPEHPFRFRGVLLGHGTSRGGC